MTLFLNPQKSRGVNLTYSFRFSAYISHIDLFRLWHLLSIPSVIVSGYCLTSSPFL
jgi:hypothetical protein